MQATPTVGSVTTACVLTIAKGAYTTTVATGATTTYIVDNTSLPWAAATNLVILTRKGACVDHMYAHAS